MQEFYEKYILPKLTHWICSQNDITRQRKKVVPMAKGRVLEIGIGSGLNLPFYIPQNVTCLWGVEPSDQLRKITKNKAAGVPFPVKLIGLSGEDIPLEKNTVDTVLVTYTLCSIPDVQKALSEMKRVLKPGGELIFCEHGLSPDKRIQQWQQRIDPVWTQFSGGCHLSRPIPELIEKSGFKMAHLNKGYNSTLKITGYNYWGTAVHS